MRTSVTDTDAAEAAAISQYMTKPTPLRRARFEAGLSQIELAAKAGISQPYVSHLECDRRPAGPALRKKMADALNVPASELFPST